MLYTARVEITIPLKQFSNVKPEGVISVELPDDISDEKALQLIERVNNLALKACQSQFAVINKQMKVVQEIREQGK